MVSQHHRFVAIFAAALAVGALSSCAADTTTSGSASGSAAACPLTVSDSWVKAADADMTGAFGVVHNPSDAEIVVTAATSPAAGMMEIHEVVVKDGASVMQPKAGGLVVPAGGSATLAPGQDHLMLMQLPAPIEAGDPVQITITCSSGGTVEFTAVAKPFEGAVEKYEPSASSSASESPSPSQS
ncbi:MAG: copper chaperone PCu(A)C [Candidatus Nanopelagicales bacterium]